MKALLIFLIFLGLLGGGGYALYQWIPDPEEAENNRILTNTAALRDLQSVVSASGEVLPKMSSIVKSEISGRIETILVEEGDSVERDQVLMQLERTSVLTRVREAERNLESARLQKEKAERNFQQLKELYAKKFVGEKEYLDSETDFKLANLDLEIAQARLEDAEEDLAKTSILAPHDGIVTRMDVVEGLVISSATSASNGTELLTVSQLKELYMEANISEVDVDLLHEGQLTELTFDAIQDFELEGTIDVIAPSARRDGNVRVFPIEVVFESIDARVRPGVSATVEIPIASVSDVVSVLLSAVFHEDDDTFVFLQKGTGWERRLVEPGINNLQHVEIKSGLEAGDVVALSRPAGFRGGDE